MTDNNKVPKKTLFGWTSVYVAAVAIAGVLLVLFSNTMPAHSAAARRDADKHVIRKEAYWSEVRSYQAPNLVGSGTHTETYRISTATEYYWWPDGNDVNKLAPVNAEVCYERLAGGGQLFQGVNSRPTYRDDNDEIEMADIAVDDNGKSKNCVGVAVPIADRDWLRMDQSPATKIAGKLRIKFSPDDNFDYRWGGKTIRYFQPDDDPKIGDWFWCDCSWGGPQH